MKDKYVRIVANQNGEVEQVNHYYPYGGLMGESTSSDHQPYKYNGKELDRHHGLDWFDYGARWYNGYSWMTPDPLAEKYYDTSPYVYCADNPLRYIDPTGMFYGDYYNLLGKKIGTDGIDDQMKYLVLNSDEQKIISKRDKQGETTQLSSLSSAINVPSNQVVSAMEQSFSLTEEKGLEHGFRVGMAGTVTSIISGTKTEISDWSIPIAELKAKGEYAAYDVHTHPKGNPEKSEEYGLAAPSDEDKQNIIKSSGQPSVVLGYYEQYQSHYLQQIGYYNEKGLIAPSISFDKFKKAVVKINNFGR